MLFGAKKITDTVHELCKDKQVTKKMFITAFNQCWSEKIEHFKRLNSMVSLLDGLTLKQLCVKPLTALVLYKLNVHAHDTGAFSDVWITLNEDDNIIQYFINAIEADVIVSSLCGGHVRDDKKINTTFCYDFMKQEEEWRKNNKENDVLTEKGAQQLFSNQLKFNSQFVNTEAIVFIYITKKIKEDIVQCLYNRFKFSINTDYIEFSLTYNFTNCKIAKLILCDLIAIKNGIEIRYETDFTIKNTILRQIQNSISDNNVVRFMCALNGVSDFDSMECEEDKVVRQYKKWNRNTKVGGGNSNYVESERDEDEEEEQQ